MKKILAGFIVVLSVLSIGCTATMPVQTGGAIGKTADREKVYTSVSAINFLGLSPMSFEKNEEALKSLQAKCNDGEVTAVASMVRHTWLLFFSHEKLEISGYCV